MECIILAGGLGTRLRSVIGEYPKCMALVNDKPFIFYLLNYLEKKNCKHVILSLGFKHEVVTDWIIGLNWDMKISFSIESSPLGTGGAIKKAMQLTTNNDVLVLNGDTFFNIDLHAFYLKHKETLADISLALKPMKDFSRYGNVVVENNIITSFNEKEFCSNGLINGGVYFVNTKFDTFKNLGTKFSFESEVLEKGVVKQNIIGIIADKYFIDIGVPEDYERANNDFIQIVNEDN